MAQLVFHVQADYEEVIRLRNEIEKLKKELKGMDATVSPAAFNTLNTQLSASTQKMDELVTEAAKAGAEMEQGFKRKIFDASQVVNGLSEKITLQRGTIQQLKNELSGLKDKYREALKQDGNTSELETKIKEVSAKLRAQKDVLFGLTQEQANARLSVKKLRDEYALYRDDSKETVIATEGIGISLKKAFAMIGGAALGKQLISDMIRVRGEFQAADTAIQTLLGSKEKADALMSQVREYAKISPLEFSDVTQATQMMLGFNIEAEKVPRFLQAIGDVSMGETQKFNSLTLAFSQMSAAGKLMGQDLNQMINAGFNPLQTMSEKTGKSIAQLKEEMSKGAISAEMVQQAFIDATSAGGKFYQMSENASKTINGQLSMMQDAMDAAFNEMGQKSEGFIMSGIQMTTKLIENYETVGKVLAGLVITYGTYKAALITNIALTHSWAVAARADAVAKGMQTAATKAATVAQLALNAAMKANPYALVAAAIASVAAAMWVFNDSTTAAEEAQKKLSDSTTELNKTYSEEKYKIDELFDALKNSKEGTEEYKKTKDTILNQYGEYLAKLGDEKHALDNIALAYKAVTEGAWRAAKARMKASLWEKEGSDRMDREKDDREELLKAVKDFYGNRSGAEKDYMKIIKRIETGKDLPNGEWTNELGKYSKKIAAQVNRLLKSREAYNENIALYEKMYGDIEEESEEVVIKGHKRNKKYYEEEKKKAQAEYDELTKAERKGKKGAALRKKIASYQSEIDGWDTSGKKTAAAQKTVNKAKKDRLKQEKQQAEYAALLDKQREERIKKQRDNEYEIWQNEIDLMKEGNKKALALIELDYDRQIAAIEDYEDKLRQEKIDAAKAAFEKNPANKDKVFDESGVDVKMTEQETRLVKSMRDKADHEREQSIKDLHKAELQSMRDYLKEYGTYLQKYGAIIEEFNEKRAELDEGDIYGAKILDKQQDEALKKLEEAKSALQLEDLGWDTLFNDLDKYTTDYLRRLQERLAGTLDTATMQNVDLIKQKIKEIDRIISTKKGMSGIFSQNGLFGGSSWGRASQVIQQQRQLEMNAASDEQALADKRKEILDQYDDLAGMDSKNITSDNARVQASLSKEDLKALQGAEGQALKSGAAASAGSGAAALAATDAIIHGVNDNIQSFAEAADYLWDEDSDMNKSVKKFAESSQYAAQGWESLKSGDFVGVITNVGNAVSSLGESFGIWSNSNRAEIEAENEKLANAMQVNTAALDRLTKKLDEGTAADKAKTYEQAKNLMSANEAAAKQTMKNNLSMYDGGHSLQKDFNDTYKGGDMMQRMSNFFKRPINTIQDFFELSAEEMNRLYENEEGRNLLTEFTQAIINSQDEGNYNGMANDLMDYMSTYNEDTYKELEDQFRSAITGVSFSDFKKNYKSALMDMEKDNKDFAKDFQTQLMQSILNTTIESKYKDRLEELYKDWNKAMEDDELTPEEISRLQAKETALTDAMIAERDRIADIIGYDDVSSSEASGSINTAKGITDDTANELVGRVTAVQLTEERLAAGQQQQFIALTQISGNISAMVNQVSGIHNIADETRSILANSYMELQQINENTREVVKPIKLMQSDIAEMKRKL